MHLLRCALLLASCLIASRALAAPDPLEALNVAGAIPVDVLAPDVLAKLEADKFSFGAVIGATVNARNDVLFAESVGAGRAWHDVATLLTDDLARFEKAIEGTRDDTHKFIIRELATSSAGAYAIESNGDAPRQLDARWLRSPLSFMKLVAVVPRFDRRDFDATSPCGEVRFVYRLAYATTGEKPVRSSLPFFVNVVMRPTSTDCSAVFRSWVAPAVGDDVVAWLLKGPLAQPHTIKQIEVNFQSLRFSAGYMTDIGGQALYILRIFRLDATTGAFAPIGLENTPDVDAIRADGKLRAQLVAFLAKPENQKKLDEGTLVIPDFDGKLLARLGVSWSTLGRARLGNKPYRDLLGDKGDVVGLSAQQIERLDNLTCMGCHQSGGTAGFHMLGRADDRVNDAFNQPELPFSPHYGAERTRRAAVFASYVKDASGKSAPHFRPHSFFPPADWSKGAPQFRAARAKEACRVDGSLPCAEGLACEKTVTHSAIDVAFGECVPTALVAGSVCQPGTIVGRRATKSASSTLPSSTFDFLDAFERRAPLFEGKLAEKFTKEKQNCRPPSIGVPLGRTFRLCTDAEKKLAPFANGAVPDEICAAVGGSKFEECATGDDVLLCLAGAVTRGMVDTCSPTRFCREDYICQRLPKPLAGASDARVDELHKAHVGFCTPTYFLFNMRADGHPDPTSGAAHPMASRATEYRGGWTKKRAKP